MVPVVLVGGSVAGTLGARHLQGKVQEVRAGFERHEKETYQQIATQARGIAAFTLVAKGKGRRVVVPEAILENHRACR